MQTSPFSYEPGSRYVQSTPIGSLLAKTYGLLSLTLLVSAAASIYGMHSAFAYQHPFILMIGSFVLLFAVQFTGAHRSPLAVPLVFLFAGGMGMMMVPAIAMFNFDEAWRAVVLLAEKLDVERIEISYGMGL